MIEKIKISRMSKYTFYVNRLKQKSWSYVLMLLNKLVYSINLNTEIAWNFVLLYYITTVYDNTITLIYRHNKKIMVRKNEVM